MSSSFPFFAIANKHNVPYAEVLRLADKIENSVSLLCPGIDSDIWDALKSERQRRFEIEKDLPRFFPSNFNDGTIRHT